jgi:uncharacterized RDD family membrane protein YckC
MLTRSQVQDYTGGKTYGNRRWRMRCAQCGQENPPSAKFCSRCGAPLPVQPEPVKTATPGSPPAVSATTALPKAGFWIRFGAAIIDGLIVSAASFIIRLPFVTPLGLFHGGGFSAMSSSLFTSVGAMWLYHWLMIGLNKGQTVGKMAVGIKVVDKNGNKPGLGQAALREIVGKTVSAIILYIGYLMVAWDSQKQGLHDKIADTYVVTTK